MKKNYFLNKRFATAFAVAFAAMGFALPVRGGVYDDVAYWLKPNDRTGNGYVRSAKNGAISGNYGADFVNVKTASDGSSSVTNRFPVYGYPNGVGISSETVRLPMSGDELANVPCLKFSPHEWIDTSVTPWSTNSQPNVMRSKDSAFINGVFKDITTDYTIMTRLRRDPSSQITLDKGWENYILGFFYKSSSGGVRLVLEAGADDNARPLRVQYANGIFSDSVCIMPTNKWTDIAIVSSNGGKTLDVYARVEGEALTNDICHVTATLTGAYTLTPCFSDGIFLFAGSQPVNDPRQIGGTSQADGWRTFYGSVQHLAVWSRALSIDDVREAFAGTQPDLWRVGLADGSATEFAGESNLASLDVAPSSWHLMPKGLDATVPSYAFNFRVRENQVGLAQMFRFKATPASASGTVSLAVNGSPLETLIIAPSKEAVFYIPTNRIASGVNTLALTRQDAGAGRLEWDCLALGGSWILGDEDGSYNDFKNSSAMNFYPVRDGLPGILYHTLSDYTAATRARSIVFELTEAMLQRGFRFQYETEFVDTQQYFTSYGKSVAIALNGTPIGVATPAYRSTLPYSIKLPGDLLVAGANTITFSVPDRTEAESAHHYWTRFDFHRLKVLPPPVGFLFSIR